MLCLLSHRGMASEALQGMQVTQAYLEPRAFQENWAPQDWAYQDRRASVDSLEMLGSLDLQASPVLQAPQEPQDSQVLGDSLCFLSDKMPVSAPMPPAPTCAPQESGRDVTLTSLLLARGRGTMGSFPPTTCSSQLAVEPPFLSTQVQNWAF